MEYPHTFNLSELVAVSINRLQWKHVMYIFKFPFKRPCNLCFVSLNTCSYLSEPPSKKANFFWQPCWRRLLWALKLITSAQTSLPAIPAKALNMWVKPSWTFQTNLPTDWIPLHNFCVHHVEQNYPPKPRQNSYPRNKGTIWSRLYFKSLSFEAICYIAINW